MCRIDDFDLWIIHNFASRASVIRSFPFFRTLSLLPINYSRTLLDSNNRIITRAYIPERTIFNRSLDRKKIPKNREYNSRKFAPFLFPIARGIGMSTGQMATLLSPPLPSSVMQILIGARSDRSSTRAPVYLPAATAAAKRMRSSIRDNLTRLSSLPRSRIYATNGGGSKGDV